MPTTIPSPASAAQAPPEHLTTVLNHGSQPVPSDSPARTPSRSLLRASYAELYRLAEPMVAAEGRRAAMDPRTLVNEAARHSLGASGLQDLDDRSGYRAFLANSLWRVFAELVNARRQAQLAPPPLWLAVDDLPAPLPLHLLLASLKRLSKRSDFHAQVAVLRIFGGMTNLEIAEQLSVTADHVGASWRLARCWILHRAASSAISASEG